ncbi:hypothetical protein KBD69_00395 [Candidatus Woesebacteria bacterium]|nr:hypothetical protein [Candidatus Woesebacteria bacterium]
MSIDHEAVYSNIRLGPESFETVKHFMYRVTSSMLVIAAEQAAAAINRPELSEKLTLALAETVNTFSSRVYQFYGKGGNFKDALNDAHLNTILKNTIKRTPGELSKIRLLHLVGSTNICSSGGPSQAIVNTPLSVLETELFRIDPNAVRVTPTIQTLKEATHRKISDKNATEYRDSLFRALERSYTVMQSKGCRDVQLEPSVAHTAILGMRQAAILWQVRQLYRAATFREDGIFDPTPLKDYQFASYDQMVANSLKYEMKASNNPVAANAHALLTMCQDLYECVPQ